MTFLRDDASTDTTPPDVMGKRLRRIRRPTAELQGLVRRVGWGILDQGVSSLSNFVLGILVARTLTPHQFGAFSLAFLTFGFVLSASRGPSTDPLMVRFSGPQTPEWRGAVAASSATAVAGGVVGGVGCVIVGLLLPGGLGAGFLALGIGLPGIMLQDSYRFAAFSCGRGDRALVNDLVWGVLQTAAVLALIDAGRLTAGTAILAFGVTATIAGVLGCWQCGVLPRFRPVAAWLRDHRDLGGRYLIENVSVGAARQLRMTAVGVIAGLAAVGQIRAAEILMGPFLMLLSGVSQVAVPEARHVLLRSPDRLKRFCLALASGQALLAATWGIAVLVVLPLGVGEMLLGDLWKGAYELLVPILLALLLGCLRVSAAAGLRALGASKRSLAAELGEASANLTCGVLGAFVAGAAGSCWGFALGSLVGAVLWWRQLGLGLAEHRASPSAEVVAGVDD